MPYVPGHAQVSHHEWRTAENSSPHLLEVVAREGLGSKEVVLLDVGAGSGTISLSLARRLPEGRVFATDISDSILEKAERFARDAGVSNVSTRRVSVFDLVEAFGERSFDVVHAHQVLCHLEEPVAALAQMLRVCKPGGVVSLREADLRMTSYHPQLPGLLAFHRLQLATHEDSGGTFDGGPRLMSWALGAGARRTQLAPSMGTWCYSTPEEKRMWSHAMVDRLAEGAIRQKALQLSLATEDGLEEMIVDWRRWMEADDACYGSMHGQLIIHM